MTGSTACRYGKVYNSGQTAILNLITVNLLNSILVMLILAYCLIMMSILMLISWRNLHPQHLQHPLHQSIKTEYY